MQQQQQRATAKNYETCRPRTHEDSANIGDGRTLRKPSTINAALSWSKYANAMHRLGLKDMRVYGYTELGHSQCCNDRAIYTIAEKQFALIVTIIFHRRLADRSL